MAEYDFLTQEPDKRPAKAAVPGGRAKSGAAGAKPRTAASSVAEGDHRGKYPARAGGAALSGAAVGRELEREGITMTALEQAERDTEQARAEGREAAVDEKAEYEARVSALNERIGKHYEKDLILYPHMWAAQDLQPGYGARQTRTATGIIAVEIPRIVRVLEAAGLTITQAKPKSAAE